MSTLKLCLSSFRGNHEAETKHFLMTRHHRGSGDFLSLAVQYCCVTVFNMLSTRHPNVGYQWEDGDAFFFLFKVLFFQKIKQHFVDNYYSLQLSLHKTQFGAARSLQRIHLVVWYSICSV